MAEKVEQERLVRTGARSIITNPGKLLFREARVSKLDLARYYLAVAPGALRGAGGRPCILVRLGDPHEGMDQAACSLESLLELSARQERDGQGDAPWPPHYRKQSGEPPRIQPSRRAKAADPPGISPSPSRPRKPSPARNRS